MEPICKHKGCTKAGEIEISVTHTSDNEMYDEPIYLCEDHARKLVKELLIGEAGNENE